MRRDALTIQKQPYGLMRTMILQEKAGASKAPTYGDASPVNPAMTFTMVAGISLDFQTKPRNPISGGRMFKV